MDWEDIKIKHVFELPEGGKVEVTDEQLVPMGDTFAYRQVTYRSETVEAVFEVRKGAPGCVSVKLTGDGQNPIRTKDLVAINLDQLREDAFAVTGVLMPDSEGGHELTHQSARPTLDRAASRRKLTPDRLEKIAQVYNDAPAGARTAAVRAAFTVSERQALRYTKLAREKGLINGSTSFR